MVLWILLLLIDKLIDNWNKVVEYEEEKVFPAGSLKSPIGDFFIIKQQILIGLKFNSDFVSIYYKNFDIITFLFFP